MRLVNVVDFLGPGVAVELVLLLSAECVDPVSKERPLPAATEARSERGDWPGPEARSAITTGAEITGGVEASSVLAETMRRGMRRPGYHPPMRE